MDNKETVLIRYGAMADSLATQLIKQKLKYAKERVAVFQKEIDAINQLRFGSNLLSESMVDKLFNKLHKKILSHLDKNN